MMKHYAKRILMLVTVNVAIISAYGEYRIWTNNKGYSIEAEYQSLENGLVVIKKKDGKVYRLPLSSLCEKDREYLENIKGVDATVPEVKDGDSSVLDVEKPPRLDVRVITKTNTGVYTGDWKERDVSCAIQIKKSSMQPYTRKMTAKMYVLGKAKAHNWYVMLDKKEFTFDFNVSDSAELPGGTCKTRYYVSYSGGIKYEGYLVVIYDDAGNELDIESSSNKFRDSRSKISKFALNDVFTEKYERKGSRNSMGIKDWDW